jgi:hypothetical protein
VATFKSFSLRTDPTGGLAIGIEVDPERGRADTGSLEMDLTDLGIDLAAAAAELGVGPPCSSTRCRTSSGTS